MQLSPRRAWEFQRVLFLLAPQIYNWKLKLYLFFRSIPLPAMNYLICKAGSHCGCSFEKKRSCFVKEEDIKKTSVGAWEDANEPSMKLFRAV